MLPMWALQKASPSSLLIKKKKNSQEIHVKLESRFRQWTCIETSVFLKAHFLMPYENKLMLLIEEFV